MVPLVVLAAVLSSAPAPLPTAAVMPLQPRNGVSQDAAMLVTENLVDELRRSRAFDRVTSWPELQALLSIEQTKQLADCDESSCVTEVMGALNVDYAVLGSLGKLGRHWLVNVQLLHVKSSSAVSSVSLRVCATDEGGLLASIIPAVTSILNEGRLSRRAAVPLPGEYRDCRDPSEALKAPEQAAAGPSRRGVIVRVGAVGGGVVAVVVGLVAGALSAIGGTVTGYYVSRLLTPEGLASLPTPTITNEARLLILWGAAAVMGVPALLLGVGALLFVGVGLTAVVVGLVLGVLS